MFRRAHPHLNECRQSGSDAATELFIVEGVSASLAVCSLRDAEFQAVLSMQGKPANAFKASSRALRENTLFRELRAALGYGSTDNTSPASDVDMAACRYQQLVLLFDPDADGIHCGALMLLYLYQQFPGLLAAGRIGIIRPPLFEMSYRETAMPDAPSHSRFAYTEDEYRLLQRELILAGVIGMKTHRMRGLGGMPTELLRSTCIDRRTRHWFPLSVDDARSTMLLLAGSQSIA